LAGIRKTEENVMNLCEINALKKGFFVSPADNSNSLNIPLSDFSSYTRNYNIYFVNNTGNINEYP
jgi:hypothetical protein